MPDAQEPAVPQGVGAAAQLAESRLVLMQQEERIKLGSGSFENACDYQRGRSPGGQEGVEHPRKSHYHLIFLPGSTTWSRGFERGLMLLRLTKPT